jgi:hypothetical protein
MKKIIFIILTVAALKAVGQQDVIVSNDPEGMKKEAKFEHKMDSLKVENPKEYYRIMSRKMANNGLISLGIGAVCSGIVVLHFKDQPLIEQLEKDSHTEYSAFYYIMAFTGAFFLAGSLVCFYKSGHYNNKAVSLSLNSQQILVPQPNGLVFKSTPTFGLRINF